MKHECRFARVISTADDGRRLMGCDADPRCIETRVVVAVVRVDVKRAA